MKAAEVEAIRTKLGLTQLELGQRLELKGDHPDRTIRLWEKNGVTGPPAVALRLLLNKDEKAK